MGGSLLVIVSVLLWKIDFAVVCKVSNCSSCDFSASNILFTWACHGSGSRKYWVFMLVTVTNVILLNSCFVQLLNCIHFVIEYFFQLSKLWKEVNIDKCKQWLFLNWGLTLIPRPRSYQPARMVAWLLLRVTPASLSIICPHFVTLAAGQCCVSAIFFALRGFDWVRFSLGVYCGIMRKRNEVQVAKTQWPFHVCLSCGVGAWLPQNWLPLFVMTSIHVHFCC